MQSLWRTLVRRQTDTGQRGSGVDGRRTGGLLNEEHQHFLADVDRAAPPVLLFDDTFGQHRHATDLGVTAVLDSPIPDAHLLAVLLRLSGKPVAGHTGEMV